MFSNEARRDEYLKSYNSVRAEAEQARIGPPISFDPDVIHYPEGERCFLVRLEGSGKAMAQEIPPHDDLARVGDGAAVWAPSAAHAVAKYIDNFEVDVVSA